jgi:hypothetical protein
VNTLELFLRNHAIVHRLEVGEPEGQFSLESNCLHGLTDEQLRLRPGGWNSIAWILWHLARMEDVAVNVMVGEDRQVFDRDDWANQLRVSRRDVGTGMSDSDVEELSRTIDLPSLRAYRLAVGRDTRDVARELPQAEWDKVADRSMVERALSQGAFSPEAKWMGEVWEGKSKAWFLSWVAVGHSHMHLGQVRWIKEMILAQRGR